MRPLSTSPVNFHMSRPMDYFPTLSVPCNRISQPRVQEYTDFEEPGEFSLNTVLEKAAHYHQC